MLGAWLSQHGVHCQAIIKAGKQEWLLEFKPPKNRGQYWESPFYIGSWDIYGRTHFPRRTHF